MAEPRACQVSLMSRELLRAASATLDELEIEPGDRVELILDAAAHMIEVGEKTFGGRELAARLIEKLRTP